MPEGKDSQAAHKVDQSQPDTEFLLQSEKLQHPSATRMKEWLSEDLVLFGMIRRPCICFLGASEVWRVKLREGSSGSGLAVCRLQLGLG